MACIAHVRLKHKHVAPVLGFLRIRPMHEAHASATPVLLAVCRKVLTWDGPSGAAFEEEPSKLTLSTLNIQFESHREVSSNLVRGILWPTPKRIC